MTRVLANKEVGFNLISKLMIRYRRQIWTAITAAILLIFSLTAGCGTNADDRMREDAVQYSNDLSLLIVLEVEAGAVLKSVIGENYTNDELMRSTLLEQVMPKYQEFLDGLEEITPSTEEIAEIHEKFLQGANDHMTGFGLLIRSIDEGSFSLMSESNTIIAKARRAMQEALAGVTDIAAGISPPTKAPPPAT